MASELAQMNDRFVALLAVVVIFFVNVVALLTGATMLCLRAIAFPWMKKEQKPQKIGHTFDKFSVRATRATIADSEKMNWLPLPRKDVPSVGNDQSFSELTEQDHNTRASSIVGGHDHYRSHFGAWRPHSYSQKRKSRCMANMAKELEGVVESRIEEVPSSQLMDFKMQMSRTLITQAAAASIKEET